MRTISIINKSSKVTNAQASLMASVCNKQIRRHVAPAWGRKRADVVFVDDESTLSADKEVIYIMDEPNIEGAFGYHDETSEGKYIGYVFVDVILANDGKILEGHNSVSATLSHEVLEQFINGDINKWAEDGEGNMFWMEICDAVQSDSYNIKGVAVSNFVYPEWFDLENPPETVYDHMKLCTAPFEVREGGWIVFQDSNSDWWQINGKDMPEWQASQKMLKAEKLLEKKYHRKKGLPKIAKEEAFLIKKS